MRMRAVGVFWGLSFLCAWPAVQAAGPKVGMAEQPCPPPLELSPVVRKLIVYLFLEPRKLTPADIERFTKHPELVKLSEAGKLQAAQDWPGLCRYRAANAVVSQEKVPPRVVFLGDSITENWGLADPAFFGNGMVNRGISGQTSAQMLVRFRADVVSLRPQTVHILAGTNDVAGNTGPTSPQDFKNNIVSMVELAKANGIAVILGSIPPAASFFWRPQLQPAAQIRELNSWLREYSSRNSITFVDYHAALAGADGELSPNLGNDGVHPNKNGYAVMRKRVKEALPAKLPAAPG